jgi:co-chaperonin GroES (HSP10)
MKPIGKYIVIQPIEEQLKSDSGLILTSEDSSNFRYKKGEIVEAGTDVSVINKGDLIYYDGAAGHTMFIKNTVYTVILERDVVVVL